MDYRFLVIINRHSALEYFFHYNHDLNSNKWAYFKSWSSNSLKVYIFGMCTLREIIWYIIHANRMLLKIWPHLTFRWPFVNISLTIHPTHSKPYIFVTLITSRVIWYTWEVIWSILKIWPPLNPSVTPTGKGPNRPKFCQNIFWPIPTSKPSITHFRQNGTWVLLPLQSSLTLCVWHEVSRVHTFWSAKTQRKHRVFARRFQRVRSEKNIIEGALMTKRP